MKRNSDLRPQIKGAKFVADYNCLPKLRISIAACERLHYRGDSLFQIVTILQAKKLIEVIAVDIGLQIRKIALYPRMRKLQAAKILGDLCGPRRLLAPEDRD
ncbi:MAG: hypothetical protein EA385_00540 [Salinarimonadaceae bacterium]|nr:MAG: hypothetical protein EA385_00540 [Salinarimonadaceae bacterium]